MLCSIVIGNFWNLLASIASSKSSGTSSFPKDFLIVIYDVFTLLTKIMLLGLAIISIILIGKTLLLFSHRNKIWVSSKYLIIII